MQGHTALSWKACWMHLVVLVSIADVAAQKHAAAAAAAGLPAASRLVLTPHGSNTSSATTCRVNIRGVRTGSISTASLKCSGGTSIVTVAADESLTGFQRALGGVVWSDKCGVPGCLLTFCGTSRTVINDSRITGINITGIEVVVCVADTARLTLQHTTITNNSATALAAFNKSRVMVAASRLAHNVGRNFTGGALVDHSAALVITNHSKVMGNVGNVSGGGVTAWNNATVTIAGASRVWNNTSGDNPGGGVAMLDNARLTITERSSVCFNTAKGRGNRFAAKGRGKRWHAAKGQGTYLDGAGGGLWLAGSSHATIKGASKVCNNTCIGVSVDGGGGVRVQDEARLTITDYSTVCDNRAKDGGGGGLSLSDMAQVIITNGSQVCNNTSNVLGGGVFVGGGARLIIDAYSSISNNKGSGGGGVYLYNRANVTISGASEVYNNTCTGAVGGGGVAVGENAHLTITGGSMVCDNEVGAVYGPSNTGSRPSFGGGGLYAEGNATINITDSIICGNTCFLLQNGGGGAGMYIHRNSSVFIGGTSQVVRNRLDAGSGGAAVVDDTASLTIGEGVTVKDNGIDRGEVGSNIALYGKSSLIIYQGVNVTKQQLTKCHPTIYLGRLPCQEGEYVASGLCQCCPEFQYGFEARAASCQPCPGNARCPGGTVVLPVKGCFHSAKRSVQMHACPIATSCPGNGDCAEGYTGNLCGACAKGYGQTLPLRCGKCMNPAHQFGVYVVLVSITVLLITVTVHFTWQDNKAGDKALRPSDLIKVLVQFLQYLIILGSMSVPWPKFLTGLFAAATVVFGGASGQALSLDCWLAEYDPSTQLPLAIQRQLVWFVVSVGILLAVVLLMTAVHVFKLVVKVWRSAQPRRSSRTGQFWRKLRVAVLVVAFYAYPSLVKASLSFFACLRIDDKEKQPYPEYAVFNHTAGYWVQDIQQECFAGWHSNWALAFGLPAVVILCFGVPSCLWFFLWTSKESTATADFQEHYGFLYRNYTDRWVWWEAVWAVQTVLLTAVSVFHFMLQAYYALFAMCLVLLLSAGLQQVAQPYAQKELHRLHYTSSCCLFLSAWLSFAMFDGSVSVSYNTLLSLHTTVGVVLVVMNTCFIIWCVWTIFKTASTTLRQLAVQAQASAQALWASCYGMLRTTAANRPRTSRNRRSVTDRPMHA